MALNRGDTPNTCKFMTVLNNSSYVAKPTFKLPGDSNAVYVACPQNRCATDCKFVHGHGVH